MQKIANAAFDDYRDNHELQVYSAIANLTKLTLAEVRDGVENGKITMRIAIYPEQEIEDCCPELVIKEDTEHTIEYPDNGILEQFWEECGPSIMAEFKHEQAVYKAQAITEGQIGWV